ncbi:hypothetical protein KC614_02990 [candidate division WWE3 bacterium]|uniref:Uncharacterized protein n=1 Tax=candidate division WWE3 bacterium TaxID=2053526 RepID=A0A955LKF6_UNCKA|nr:hypothetical protein [candidate division WWE3 bacterium]
MANDDGQTLPKNHGEALPFDEERMVLCVKCNCTSGKLHWQQLMVMPNRVWAQIASVDFSALSGKRVLALLDVFGVEDFIDDPTIPDYATFVIGVVEDALDKVFDKALGAVLTAYSTGPGGSFNLDAMFGGGRTTDPFEGYGGATN